MATGRPFRAAIAAVAAAVALAADALGAIVFSNQYRSPRNLERDVRKKTSLIVLHTTEAPAKSSLNKLSERGEAHYCIAENGTVYRIIDHNRTAFHAGRSMWNARRGVDDFSIGIEVVGYHNRPVTLLQIAALRELLASLKKLYKIDDARVVAHSHVAYGVPNKWQKKSHRGRKRCGMLFAMPTVRALLGLSARPAFDPDVRARRLVNADPALARSLYGPVDTMRNAYANAQNRQARPAANNFWRRAGTKKPAAARQPKPAAAQQPKPAAAAAAPPAARPAIVRGRRIPAPGARHAAVAADDPPDGVRTIGTDGKDLEEIAGDEAYERTTIWVKPDGAWGTGARLKKGAVLPRGTRVLVGYEPAGQVSRERNAIKICGGRWKSPYTYYFHGTTLTPGDKIDDRAIRNGTMIFVRK